MIQKKYEGIKNFLDSNIDNENMERTNSIGSDVSYKNKQSFNHKFDNATYN